MFLVVLKKKKKKIMEFIYCRKLNSQYFGPLQAGPLRGCGGIPTPLYVLLTFSNVLESPKKTAMTEWSKAVLPSRTAATEISGHVSDWCGHGFEVHS